MSDFTLRIESVEEQLDFNVRVSKKENGTEQRRLVHPNALIGWKLTSPALTASQLKTYRDFILGKYGALTSFTWTCHIDNVEYTVRFSTGSFKTKYMNGYYVAEFAFERVI